MSRCAVLALAASPWFLFPAPSGPERILPTAPSFFSRLAREGGLGWQTRILLSDGTIREGRFAGLAEDRLSVGLTVKGEPTTAVLSVPLDPISGVSTRNPNRGALKGLFAGLGIGLMVGLPPVGYDLSSDYTRVDGAITALSMVVGGATGYLIGARRWGWKSTEIAGPDGP